MKKSTEYYFWSDLIRVVSIFLVVLLHTSAGLLYQWGHIPVSYWWAANLYDSLSRISVPLFVMLSGALLLTKQENYLVFFRKRVNKILLPWLFWTGIYVIWAVTFHGAVIHSLAEFKRLVIETFLGGFWFLVMLAGLYLITPLWRIFVRHAEEKDYRYFFLLWVIVVSVLPFIGNVLQHQLLASLPLSLQYSGYFVFGFWLAKRKITASQQKKLLGLGVSMCLVIALGTYWISSQHHVFIDLFYDFLNPIQVVCATAFFLVFKKVDQDQVAQFLHFTSTGTQSKLQSLLLKLSQATFGIYLVHVIILETLERGIGWFRLTADFIHPLFAIPILAAVVYFISFGVIIALRRLPLGKLLS